MTASVAALRATLEETRAKLDAALDAREAATRARNEAESAWYAARDAVRAADPIYDALTQAMDAADLDGHAYDHDDWCNRVDRFRAAFAKRGFDIVRRGAATDEASLLAVLTPEAADLAYHFTSWTDDESRMLVRKLSERGYQITKVPA